LGGQWVDAGAMAAPRIDLAPLGTSSTAYAEAQMSRIRRAGSIGWAAAIGWYVALAMAAIGDAVSSGHLTAVVAMAFVGLSVVSLLWAGGYSLDRVMCRCLLMGVIGLLAGVAACLATPWQSAIAGECLCFGAMAMLFAVLMTFPPALAAVCQHAE
jgi:hypothetical protein